MHKNIFFGIFAKMEYYQVQQKHTSNLSHIETHTLEIQMAHLDDQVGFGEL